MVIYKNAKNYLCYFISGVPFDSKKDLGKDLWDVHAIMPDGERERGQMLCVATQHAAHPNVQYAEFVLNMFEDYEDCKICNIQ